MTRHIRKIATNRRPAGNATRPSEPPARWSLFNEVRSAVRAAVGLEELARDR